MLLLLIKPCKALQASRFKWKTSIWSPEKDNHYLYSSIVATTSSPASDNNTFPAMCKIDFSNLCPPISLKLIVSGSMCAIYL